MAQKVDIARTKVLGIREDIPEKFMPPDYFRRIENFNFDSILGADKIKERTVDNDSPYSESNEIDGTCEYVYTDRYGVRQNEFVVASGGKLFRRVKEKHTFDGSGSGNIFQKSWVEGYGQVCATTPRFIIEQIAHVWEALGGLSVDDEILLYYRGPESGGDYAPSMVVYTFDGSKWVLSYAGSPALIDADIGDYFQVFVTTGNSRTISLIVYFNYLFYEGMSKGRVTFSVYQNKLFIANGKDFLVYDGAFGYVYDVGAPEATIAVDSTNYFNYLFKYQYQVTFVTAGGEEVTGAKSNIVFNHPVVASTVTNQVLLNVPIGYDGTTSRKIYRTENGGVVFKLLATISDNTTLTYTDYALDGTLTTQISSVNNESPKPYFILAQNSRLAGTVSDKYATQLWVTDQFIEVFDNAAYYDISDQSNDNTPVMGMIREYKYIALGTQQNIYLVDLYQTNVNITQTRANVGVKDGYSMAAIPEYAGFEGGVMFLSTQKDFKLFNSNFAQPIISFALEEQSGQSDNFSRAVKDTVAAYVESELPFIAVYYDYKYHVAIGDKILVMDIRNKGWTTYQDQDVNCFGFFGDKLYKGRKSDSYIDQMYASDTLDGAEYNATLETGALGADESIKLFKDLIFFYTANGYNELNLTVTLEDNVKIPLTETIKLTRGVGGFDPEGFMFDQYETPQVGDDFFVYHISRRSRWLKWQLVSTKGRFLYRGYRLTGERKYQKQETGDDDKC